MGIDSQRWKCVESVPAFRFSIDGVDAVRARAPSRRVWLTTAEGVVEEVGEHRLRLGGGVVLTHSLPPALSLAALLGALVRLLLQDEPCPFGPRAQTLIVTGRPGEASARTRLVARFGPAGQAHALGSAMQVRAVLSQRPAGPMIFGTDRLQYLVQVGGHARVGEAGEEYVVHFESRTAFDHVAYAMVERSLWSR